MSNKKIIIETLDHINNHGYVNVKETFWSQSFGLDEEYQNRIKSLLLKLKAVRMKEGEPFTFEITDPRGIFLLSNPIRLRNNGKEKRIYRLLSWFKTHISQIVLGVIITVLGGIILVLISPYINENSESSSQNDTSSATNPVTDTLATFSGKILDENNVGVPGALVWLIVKNDTIYAETLTNQYGVFDFIFGDGKIPNNTQAIIFLSHKAFKDDHERTLLSIGGPLFEMRAVREIVVDPPTSPDPLIELLALEQLYDASDEKETKDDRVAGKMAARNKISKFIIANKISPEEVLKICSKKTQGLLSGLAHSFLDNPKKKNLLSLHKSYNLVDHNFTAYTYALVMGKIFDNGLTKKSDCDMIGDILAGLNDSSSDHDTSELVDEVREKYLSQCAFAW